MTATDTWFIQKLFPRFSSMKKMQSLNLGRLYAFSACLLFFLTTDLGTLGFLRDRESVLTERIRRMYRKEQPLFPNHSTRFVLYIPYVLPSDLKLVRIYSEHFVNRLFRHDFQHHVPAEKLKTHFGESKNMKFEKSGSIPLVHSYKWVYSLYYGRLWLVIRCEFTSALGTEQCLLNDFHGNVSMQSFVLEFREILYRRIFVNIKSKQMFAPALPVIHWL